MVEVNPNSHTLLLLLLLLLLPLLLLLLLLLLPLLLLLLLLLLIPLLLLPLLLLLPFILACVPRMFRRFSVAPSPSSHSGFSHPLAVLVCVSLPLIRFPSY